MDGTEGIIVTVTKDDSGKIKHLCNCIMSQSIQPSTWIIVDDQSGDKCLESLRNLAKKHSWIDLHENSFISQEKKRGARIARLFSYGVQNAPKEWSFCSKIDSDMELENTYFEEIYSKFSEDHQLGIASGNCKVKGNLGYKTERVTEGHTRGGLKTYRRACYDSISEVFEVEGWDTLDGYFAQKEGWKTRNFQSIIAHQSRRTGQGVGFLKTAYNQGRICHYINYYPPYFLARVVSIIPKKYPFFSSLSMLSGYLSSVILSKSRYDDKELLNFLRSKQKKKIIQRLRYK